MQSQAGSPTNFYNFLFKYLSIPDTLNFFAIVFSTVVGAFFLFNGNSILNLMFLSAHIYAYKWYLDRYYEYKFISLVSDGLHNDEWK